MNLRGSAYAAALTPTALAAAYVLNAWVQTASSPFAVGRALVVAVSAALIITGLAWLLTRDLRRASLATSAVLVFILFVRDAVQVALNFVHATPLWVLTLSLAALIGLAATCVVVLRRRSRPLPATDTWSRWLTLGSGALLVLVLAPAAFRGLIPVIGDDLRQGVSLEAASRSSEAGRTGPDIYVILLDGYPRADVLADQFGYDNSVFLQGLEARGFEVASSSHSNYTLTEFTLLSMFHAALLQDVPELEAVFDGREPSQPRSRILLNENPTLSALRERDYLIVGFSGTYEDVALRRADVFVQLPQMNEIEWQLLANTILLDVVAFVGPDYVDDQQRNLINAAFEAAAATAQRRDLGPRFVLAHVFAPRAPLVFGAAGEPVRQRTLRRTEDTAAAAGLSPTEFAGRLVGQVQYVNGLTTSLIDDIVAASPEPPVIIVMSDHGSRSRALDVAAVDDDLLRERFGTLFAAYTPSHSGVFPDDVTPAEVMARLLETYFDVPYERPGGGIYASEGDHYQLIRLGDAPPSPGPS